MIFAISQASHAFRVIDIRRRASLSPFIRLVSINLTASRRVPVNPRDGNALRK